MCVSDKPRLTSVLFTPMLTWLLRCQRLLRFLQKQRETQIHTDETWVEWHGPSCEAGPFIPEALFHYRFAWKEVTCCLEFVIGPQEISRRGVAEAVLVPIDQWRRLASPHWVSRPLTRSHRSDPLPGPQSRGEQHHAYSQPV